MSLATRHMTDKVTYWVKSGGDPNDPYAAPTVSAPVTLPCEYQSGGKVQRDQNGEEFAPGTTYWTVAQIPIGALVVLGESTNASPPTNAEKVRKVGGGTSLPSQPSEFVAWTG